MRSVAVLNTEAVQGTLAGHILSFVTFLDSDFGSSTWEPRTVAVVTVLVLGVIRILMGDAHGVSWYSLTHGAVSGYLSAMAVWLSIFAAVPLTGMSEPLRSITCHGPLTSMHRFVPAITMGYGLFDILDGFSHGIDFLLHGLATFSVMAYFCEYDLAEVIIPMLLMEISTPHLALMRMTLFSETSLAINMLLFTITFFLFRLLICPYLWWEILSIAWEHRNDPVSQACLPWHFKYVVFCFGMFFNCLNAYWAVKIVKKIQRKLSGKEKVKDKNHLKDG